MQTDSLKGALPDTVLPPPQDPAGTAWHALSCATVEARLGTPADGLSQDEAQARLQRFGANRLPEPPQPGPLLIFLQQFKNPLVYLLVAASAVSIVVQEFLDAAFIFGVLLLNAVIGTVQEWQARKKADELKKLVPQTVMVRRGGAWREADAATLVPGDLVSLESGSRVSADIRLSESRNLVADESLLTGESNPVPKRADAAIAEETGVADRANMLFAGTTVLSGRAQGFTVLTGNRTQIGQIASALAAGEATAPPLLGQLERFSRLIGIVTIVLIAVVATAEAVKGTALVEVFLVAIALAVAAIPEGLPIAITVALAVATNCMQQRNVILRSLMAVEGLGACTLIASDKTGTLTLNRLTVERVALPDTVATAPIEVSVSGEGLAAQGAFTTGHGQADDETLAALQTLAVASVHCNEASLKAGRGKVEAWGDTVDIAFLMLAAKLGLDIAALRSSVRIVERIPYEPEQRFAACFVRDVTDDRAPVTAHVKGAGETLLPMCEVADRNAVERAINRLASDGYRVIAVASGPCRLQTGSPAAALSGLKLLGLVGLIDPIRPEVPDAIRRCREAGISVRMITGDHPETARAIARQLDLLDRDGGTAGVVTQQDLSLLEDDPDRYAARVRDTAVFARVEPTEKLRIVQALQKLDHIVAVTGDGVNDAPALNAADIGVAMGKSGTDVAREAADLVLADDNFASIVHGVEEGRIAYDNVRKLVYLLIATGLAEIVLFLFAVIGGYPAPLFAVQLLWLNLVTNGIQHIALAFERGEDGILKRAPRPIHQKIFDRKMSMQVLTAGTYMGVVSGAAYAWFLEQGLALEAARNLTLLLMVMFENAHALNARSERLPVYRMPLSGNWFLVFSIIGAHGLHLAALFTPGLADVLRVQPIQVLDWLLVVCLALSLIFVMDLYKNLDARFFGSARGG